MMWKNVPYHDLLWFCIAPSDWEVHMMISLEMWFDWVNKKTGHSQITAIQKDSHATDPNFSQSCNFFSGNGKIEFEEFVIMMAKKMDNEGSEEDIREAFKVFDRTGCGYIMATDLKRIMTTMGDKMTQDEVEEMIAETDVDGDGQIFYEGNFTDLYSDMHKMN
jgi:calmodulin